jgi:flavodoxin
MKALIIYSSFHHQNTEKIARRIAKTIPADLISLENLKNQEIQKYQLIGLGSGIYFGRHDQRLLALVKKIARVKGKKAFVFSTSGIIRIPGLYDFHKPLRRELILKGFQIVGEFSCRGRDTYYKFLKLFGGLNKNRPNQKDFKKAQEFAKKLKKLIE